MDSDVVVFGLLEELCRGARERGVARVRIAFAMLDVTARTWVFDPRRPGHLFAPEAPIDVALTLTCRPKTLLRLLATGDSTLGPDEPLLCEGDRGALVVLRDAAAPRRLGPLDVRCL